MNIIELAIATQLIDHRDTEESLPADFVQSLREFATAIRAQTLEEAAGVCDNSASHCHDDGLLQLVLKSNAAAIRALKGAKE